MRYEKFCVCDGCGEYADVHKEYVVRGERWVGEWCVCVCVCVCVWVWVVVGVVGGGGGGCGCVVCVCVSYTFL